MNKPSFEYRDITLTLKGAEWFAIVAKLADKPMSKEGRELFKSAGHSIARQLNAAVDAKDDPNA